MKVNRTKKGYTLSGISGGQLHQVMFLLGHIKDGCFQDDKDANGEYHSGDGFIAVLDEQGLKDFHSFCDDFWEGFNDFRNKTI
ncbi:hypothetical protein EZS27_001397 [termite gut metagenome]|uniref:Uncharacterized protein n=1 Tax=termite gut metagenome TaxID=433724 RepID=A0A5J4T0M6_9ZZZZ